jgi:hypothetical protein
MTGVTRLMVGAVSGDDGSEPSESSTVRESAVDESAAAGGRSGGPAASDAVSMAASDVRRALQVTPHQLGELTSRLRLAVGNRPNYPRYGRREVHLLTAVLALRDLRVPLDEGCAAVTDFDDYIVAHQGWMVLYPTTDRWVAVAAKALGTVASLLTLTGRATVLDLAALWRISDGTWLQFTIRRDDPDRWSTTVQPSPAL